MKNVKVIVGDECVTPSSGEECECLLVKSVSHHRLVRNVKVIVGEECVTPSSSEECESDCW